MNIHGGVSARVLHYTFTPRFHRLLSAAVSVPRLILFFFSTLPPTDPAAGASINMQHHAALCLSSAGSVTRAASRKYISPSDPRARISFPIRVASRDANDPRTNRCSRMLRSETISFSFCIDINVADVISEVDAR